MAKSKYEYVRAFELPDAILPSTFILVRVDGRNFSTFTKKHNFSKPLDFRGVAIMERAAQTVMKEFSGDIVLAFGQSDEFSFLLKKSSNLYNRRASKLVSSVVSLFTSAYVFWWDSVLSPVTNDAAPARASATVSVPSIMIPVTPNAASPRLDVTSSTTVVPPWPLYPPSFDGRAVCYPTEKEVKDYFRWRQADTHINCLYNTCYHHLTSRPANPEFQLPSMPTFLPSPPRPLTPSEAEVLLSRTDSSMKNELLFKGFGVNYNALPPAARKGSVLRWGKVEDQNGRMRTQAVVEYVDLISEAFWEERGLLQQQV
ncbi:tRNAHis guanylyltransferase [Gonapodya prolifera JEL478]|uniref:tRNA(His) guanylyltransferase n=1 Tax=Gonapodya prolifera (strain JEL478) TaxID=1344416 RepID=A0A139ACX8_GONPJ|nr:tRNAHis guanylyltransferase [Gonapodya prolifera JEL478]|eukprot:KXS14620.1 tRNAHis guanylyltransferase [Gonapodya prolifera JEL478]